MNLEQTKYIAAMLVAATFLLLGTSFTLGANPNAIKAMAEIFSVSNFISIELLSVLVGLTFTLSGLLISFSLFSETARPLAMASLAVLFSLPLLSLMSESRWIGALGGFPMIGSGQGIIKYFALVPIFLFLFFREKLSDKQHIWLNFSAVASVLIWIGAMKFFEFEAKGIESLVANSPLMAWMYQLWDLQTVSNIIGVYDLLAVALMMLGLLLTNRNLTYVGMALAAAVFLVTQTFMVTTEGGLSGETLLTGLSHFVIKDIWYLVNLLIIFSFINTEKAN